MFIYNVKVNKTNIIKVIVVLVVLIIFVNFAFNYFNGFSGKVKTKDKLLFPNLIDVTSKNYTNVLKEVHDNFPEYLGQKIKFTGYVYRVSDIGKDEFVLARNMIVNASNETVVVGFLCKCNKADNFIDGTWVEISGTIRKGEYHGEIPIIDISNIKEVVKPADDLVYPPDDTFVQTSVVL